MKRRTLALILAAALTVTSVEGTAVMASAADFTSEVAEETAEQSLETDVFSADSETDTGAEITSEDNTDSEVFSDQGDSFATDEIEISDSESQDSDTTEDAIDIFEDAQDDTDEEEIEITDEEDLTDADEESIEVFSDGDENTSNLNGMELKSISTTQSEVTLLEDYETYYGKAISSLLRFNYTNQEPKDLDVKFGYAVRDPDGNTVMPDLVYADGENAGKSFDWNNAHSSGCYYVPKGSYKYIFTLKKDGQELMKVELPIKVESLADRYDRFESIKEGTKEIDTTNRQFYKFEPEVTGDYMISAATELSYLVMKVNEDGTTTHLVNSDKKVSCRFEQGHKYIIYVVNGSTMGVTSTNLTVKRIPETKSVEIISYTPQTLSFIRGQAPKFNSIKVRITTETGSKIMSIKYSGLYGVKTDQYGKTLSYSLYRKEDGKYKEVNPDTTYRLEKGEYAYKVFYDDVEAETLIPVQISYANDVVSENVLKMGESKTLSAKDNQISARFQVMITGKYKIEFNRDVDVYLAIVDNDTGWSYSNTSEIISESLGRGSWCYLYITSDTGLEDLQVTVTPLTTLKELEVIADNNEYTASIHSLEDINLRTKVTYSDGSEQIVGVNDPVYGGMLSYRASNEFNEKAEYYSELSAGEWYCEPYLRDPYSYREISMDRATVTGTTIHVTMPDTENLEALEEGVSKSVEPAKQKFYKFIPEESGRYETTVSDGATASIYLISGRRLVNCGYSYDLTEGTTYLVKVSTPYSADLKIGKSSDTEDNSYPMNEKYDKTFDLSDMEGPLYFTFEPTKTGYYRFWTEGNAYPYVTLWEDDKQIAEDYSYGTDNVSLTVKFEKEKTYTYRVDWDVYDGNNLTVHFAETKHQSIRSLELVPKKGVTENAMTVMNGVLDIYDLRINYADHSALVENAPKNMTGGSYSYDGTDVYGNKWAVNVNNEDTDLEAEDTQYEVELKYYDPETKEGKDEKKQIPVRGIEGIQPLENGVSVKPFQNNGLTAWYAFTPSAAGEYILWSEAEEGEAIPFVSVYSYSVEQNYNGQYIAEDQLSYEELTEKTSSVKLNKGVTYLVEISRENMDCNRDISFKIEKAKTIKNVVRKKAPDQTTVYATESNVVASLEGMVITILYTDKTEEDIAYGETDAAGRGMEIYNEYWKDAKTYRVSVAFGEYSIHVDYKKADLPEDMKEVTVGNSTIIPASDQVVVPVMFTPEKTGYYFVDVKNGSVSSVQKLATLAPNQLRMRQTKESADVTDTQYFEENTIYLIYIYTNKKEATVTIREGACKWETIAGTIVKVSCTTGESYKQECKVHNHIRVVEGDKAVGHGYSSWKVTREADCTRAGEKQRTCIYCGHVEKVQTTPAKGHKYGSWKTTKGSTVLNKGQQERICCVCKKKETKSIAKLKATIRLNVSGTIPLRTNQTFNVRVTMGKGDKVASWKSSNKRIVSVDRNGKIRGLRAGRTATITVQLRSGLKKSFKVKVQKTNVATSSLKVTNASTGKRVSSKASLKRNQTLRLAVTVSPITSRERVTYSSSDRRIVSVSSRGVIRANRRGKAIVTVRSGKKTYKIRVTVK